MNTEPQRHTVELDRWDDEDWSFAHEIVPALTNVEDKISDVNWTGKWMLGDTFGLLHKAVPKLNGDLDPAFRVNAKIAAELMDNPDIADLRQHTQGDRFVSTMATASMADRLIPMYEKLEEAQAKADEAQEAADQYGDGCEGAGVAPGSDEADAIPGLRDMRQKADDAADALDAALDKAAPGIGKAVRGAAKEAADDAEKSADDAAGWDGEGGEISRMDPAERLKTAARLANPRLRRLSELVGRIKTEANYVKSNQFDRGSDEICGVHYSNDITKLVSTELVKLAVDELNILFYKDYADRRLLTLETRSPKNAAKGGIVYVQDSSGTMWRPSDQPALYATAIGLNLLAVAIEQHRSFRVIVFSSEGMMQEFTFGGDDAADCTLEERLTYAEFVMDGATHFEGPLDAATAHLRAEFEATGKTTGDIVFATDGEAEPSEDWYEGWEQAREELGFRCFGIAISMGISATLERCCDHVTEVSRLTDGSEIGDIFAEVSKRKTMV